jgi:hypothetical protein
MKSICSNIKFYCIGNTFSLVVLVLGKLSYVFQEGYHREQDLKGLRGSQTSEGVSKKQGFVTLCRMQRGMQQMEAWFEDSLSEGVVLMFYADIIVLCIS